MSDLGSQINQAVLISPRLRDRKLLEQFPTSYQGLHVRATQAAALIEWGKLSDRPMVIDPCTFLFCLSPDRLKNKDTHQLLPEIEKLKRNYGTLISSIAGSRALTHTDLLDNDRNMADLCQEVIRFQRISFTQQISMFVSGEFEKYRAFLGPESSDLHEIGVKENIIVPPYFYFKGIDDPWFQINLACIRIVLKNRREGENIFPVILFSPKLLESSEQLNDIIDEYLSLGVDGIIIWVNEFREENASILELAGLLTLVRSFSMQGKSIIKAYSGFFSAILSKFGLGGLSCGINSSSWRNAFAYGPIKRKPVPYYYIPKLHRSIDITKASELIKTNPNLACDCKVCDTVYGKNLDNILNMTKEDYRERHFLNVRLREINYVTKTPLTTIIRDLERDSNEISFAGDDRIKLSKNWPKVLATSGLKDNNSEIIPTKHTQAWRPASR